MQKKNCNLKKKISGNDVLRIKLRHYFKNVSVWYIINLYEWKHRINKISLNVVTKLGFK